MLREVGSEQRERQEKSEGNVGLSELHLTNYCPGFSRVGLSELRPAQLAELPHSEFSPELLPHSAYVKFFVTFATKVPYLTFCDKM